jgi:hypothetical protein
MFKNRCSQKLLAKQQKPTKKLETDLPETVVPWSAVSFLVEIPFYVDLTEKCFEFSRNRRTFSLLSAHRNIEKGAYDFFLMLIIWSQFLLYQIICAKKTNKNQCLLHESLL